MGSKLSVEASGIMHKYVPAVLLIEEVSPIRPDVLVALRERFQGVLIERLSLRNSVELDSISWGKYDLILIACSSSVDDDLLWLNEIKSCNSAGNTSDEPLVIVMADTHQAGRDAAWHNVDLYLLHDVSGSEFSGRLDEALEVSRLSRKYPVVLPEWHLLKVLNDSESAVIFHAENRSREQAVIKRFKFDTSGLSNNLLQHFVSDAETLITQTDDSLVRLLDAGITEDAVYLVMEYIEGTTLKYALEACSEFDLEQRLNWFTQVTGALSVIHGFGLLHRDLKSSNILVREDGSLVLLDFGVENQLLLDSGFLREDEIYGTPFYISPERIVGEPSTVQSDLYALGILFYELLMGDKPYLGRDLGEVLQQHIFTPIPALPDNLRAYQPLLSGLLAKSPEGRIKHAGQVLSWLDEYAHQRGACAA